MKQICRLICALGLAAGAWHGAWAQPASVVVQSSTTVTSLDVTWAAARFAAATEYRVRWAQDAGSETWINTGAEAGVSAGASLAHTIPGLVEGQRYDVQVGAISSGSTTPVWSASVGGIVNRGPLAMLAFTASDGQAITLSPAFVTGTQQYTASVLRNISGATVTAATIGGGMFFLSKTLTASGGAIISGGTASTSLSVGANTLYVGALNSGGGIVGSPHIITITRAPITFPAKITAGVTARATALRVDWSAPPGDFVRAYEITWRTAATDGPDNMPNTSDDVAAGAWQNASGDDTDCAAAADPGAADDCGEDVGDVRAYT
ncbi:MAG: fibronectin type III domain-containing protein, partial [Gammaproteobacteria bacterium]